MSVTKIEVDPADVWRLDWSAGEIHVRAWPADYVPLTGNGSAMPDAGAIVRFVGRDWIVTRRNVRTEGGRSCFVAYLTAPPEAVQ